MTDLTTPLPRATSVCPRGARHDTPTDCVVLGYDDRHRRRLRLTCVRGLVFLLDLAETTALRGGDAVRLDDGRIVEIVAAAEPLVEVAAADVATAMRIAWHLGNRHLQVQLVGLKLRLRRDHVIEAMIARLGGMLRPIEAAFDPESGAYHAHGSAHGDHARGNANTHSHVLE